MDVGDVVPLTAFASVGIAGGLVLMVRGMNDYRSSLRVADTSIMPELVTGNTNAPSIMIGERAAAFIEADAK